jgi:hypothetical protein
MHPHLLFNILLQHLITGQYVCKRRLDVGMAIPQDSKQQRAMDHQPPKVVEVVVAKRQPQVVLSAYGAGGVEVNGFLNWQFGIQ